VTDFFSTNLLSIKPQIKIAAVDLVPHSQCSPRENPKFLQNLYLKNYILRANFWLIFLLNICYCNSGLVFQSQNYYIAAQNCMYFIKEISQNLSKKRKWALWMKHLDLSAKMRELTFMVTLAYNFYQKAELKDIGSPLIRCNFTTLDFLALFLCNKCL
jgi:hypothetical protein